MVKEAAQKTLILGIATDVLFIYMTTLILSYLHRHSLKGIQPLSLRFTQTPRILIASYISYLIGNLVNARVTTIVNQTSNHLRIKNLGAIALGGLVDNIIFIALSFIGGYSVIDIVIMIVSHWILSLIWNIIAQPATERTVIWAKKDENAMVE